MKKAYLILTLIFLLTSCTNNNILVSFETNGGSEISSVEVEFEKPVSEPTNPVKEGYSFVGWCSDSNLNVFYDFSKPVYSDTTLYAKWEINQYRITFNSNGGSTVEEITEDYQNSVEKPVIPTKENNLFIGWYIDKNLTYEYNFTTMPAEDITLYAKWIEYQDLIPKFKQVINEKLYDIDEIIYEYEKGSGFSLENMLQDLIINQNIVGIASCQECDSSIYLDITDRIEIISFYKVWQEEEDVDGNGIIDDKDEKLWGTLKTDEEGNYILDEEKIFLLEVLLQEGNNMAFTMRLSIIGGDYIYFQGVITVIYSE